MLTILHGSDLHFGKPHDPDAAESFVATAHAVEPDLLVLSGDFTQRAKVQEYREAATYLKRLPDVPRVLTPGNHDVPLYRVWERLFQPLRNYRQWISPDLDQVVRVPGAVVVSLDSTAPRRAIVNGRVGRDQLDFARRAFRGAPSDAVRIVVLHHHLASAPDYQRDRPIPGAGRILDAFLEMGVELVLGGHLHRSYIGNSLDAHPGEERDRGIVIVQCGTTTSRRGRAREVAKNSCNVIRVHKDRLAIVHRMLSREDGAFLPTSVHTFRRWGTPFLSRDPADAERSVPQLQRSP